MSTWRLISTDGGEYRWEPSGRAPLAHLGCSEANGDRARFPSMTDLLLQGRSRLVENDGFSATGSSAMFRTGLGKPVAVKQSSMAKALSIMRDDDLSHKGSVNKEGCGPGNTSLFQTGSGKMVSVSSAGLVRAKRLLGLEEDDEGYPSEVFGLPRKSLSNYNGYGGMNSSSWEKVDMKVAGAIEGSVSGSRLAYINDSDERRLKHLASNSLQPKMHGSSTKPASIKFQTAGGRSISISSDALKRARSLLGDPELGNFLDDGSLNDYPSNKENETPPSLHHQVTLKHADAASFASSVRHSTNVGCSLNPSKKIKGGSNLIAQFNAAASDRPDGSGSDLDALRTPWVNGSPTLSYPTVTKVRESQKNCDINPPGQVLADISNRNGKVFSNNESNTLEARFGSKISASPFKRPRTSKFSTPLKSNSTLVPSGLSKSSVQPPPTMKVSTRYPFVLPRQSMKEYFGGPPLHMGTSYNIGGISSDEAVNFMFPDDSGLNCIGIEAFFHMLIQSGASGQRVPKTWVANHYRWIVWKLACYERCYPAKTLGKFFTVSNVLEELKYRYEREVNHGHRSAIKRILEGDASPSSMLIVCVSAICLNCDLSNDGSDVASERNNSQMKLELTDGWYSMDALLDAFLSNLCRSGKIFIGQKLRICGARLCGWDAPISPLEATKSVKLLLHANGTHRAHWDDQLGFCKGHYGPLAFRCIKSNGGPVPQTLVGVTRIYPILFKESVSGGGSIVRSERMELEVCQMHNQRRTAIIDGVISEFQRDEDFHIYNEDDSEEGAKVSKLLETAEEPELLMADMSPEQLNAFAAYRSKMEGTRQSNIEKSIEKALQDAGLRKREVTPFMRVRVVGLRSKGCRRHCGPGKGLITIWNPSERMQHELIEGQAYVFSGLLPINFASDHIYLQGRGSTIKWRSLTSVESKHFSPFFSPRDAISLSRLGEVSLSSEFDTAALVLYVGEVFITDHQRKQWIFVTDGSTDDLHVGGLSHSLLAINFCWPYTNDISYVPFNPNLVGSTVGFCNLIKKAKDEMNQLWVADAMENSTYSLAFDSPLCSHLKDASVSIQAWAKMSDLTINKLRERVLFIVGDCKG
ncbi:hypothetical protein SAY86_024778 [Trapa natans]|uniref:Tower domain-containing protein n=1 Tax=Trapa natans TaxID=22666 RepID=A0AAN7RK27_TRANT|nr:hypothetical protein SAY86_024778 [Trapa natans]